MSNFLEIDKLGDGIEGGVIANILIKDGDVIDEGDVLLEMETDKALIDIRSSISGKVKKLLVKKGETAKIGQRYLEFEQLSGANAKQDKTADAAHFEPAKDNTDISVNRQSSTEQASLAEDLKISQTKQDKTSAQRSENNSAPLKNTIFKLPVLGDSIEEVILAKLLVKTGDKITIDQPVAELESDKAGFELKSQHTGKILEIYPKHNQTIKVGDDLFRIAVTASGVQSEDEALSDKPAQSAAVVDESAKDPADKMQRTATASFNNSHSSLLDNNQASPAINATDKKLNSVDMLERLSSVNAPPNVRRFAREIGVDIFKITGSGHRGRILVKDVKEYAQKINRQLDVPTHPATHTKVELPNFTAFGEIEISPLSGIKKATAKNMAHIWHTVPMVTHFDHANVSELEKIRQANKSAFTEQNAKLTMTAILIKMLALALKKFPRFNSSFDDAQLELIIKKYINIGVAVDTPNGLLVPVIKNVPSKSVLEIAIELDVLSQKSRERKISPADLSGASFTISNLGGISGSGFTPIVNWPEVAILGVAKSTMQPVYNGDSFSAALMMPLSLSYDHRVLDGAESARFLKYLVELLENPFRMALFVG